MPENTSTTTINPGVTPVLRRAVDVYSQVQLSIFDNAVNYLKSSFTTNSITNVNGKTGLVINGNGYTMSHGSGGQPKRDWYISGSLTLTMNGLTISGYSINSCNCLYQGAGVYITLSSGQVTMNSVTVKSGSTHAFAGCVGPQYSRAAGIYLYQGTLVMSDSIVKD